MKGKCKFCNGTGYEKVVCGGCEGDGTFDRFACPDCNGQGYTMIVCEECPDDHLIDDDLHFEDGGEIPF